MRDIRYLGSNQHRTRRGLIARVRYAMTRERHILGLTRGGDWDLIRFLLIVLAATLIGLTAKVVRDHWARTTGTMLVTQAYAKPYVKTETPNFKDMRARNVHAYLESKSSPLADHAEYLVAMADKHAIDYTLVAAISGKESSFGNVIKPGSHNAWGIMQWDKAGNRSLRSFASWEDGIAYTSALIGTHYRLNSNTAIGSKYCPKMECSETWAEDVTTFSEQIQNK